MRKIFLILMMVWTGAAFAHDSVSQVTAQSSQPTRSSPQPARPIGVVTQIQTGSFTLHTDSGADLIIMLPDGATVQRVPPGAKDLKAATKISVSDISSGDRVLVRGRFSGDQKSVTAMSVIVMSKTDLANAREAERMDWQRRGVGGLVKAVTPDSKEIIISIPNVPPTPGNPAHPVTITLASNAALLRYAPDSVKFSDAKPSTFDEIKVGDQVRALGTKSEDGSRFTAEKLVSGSFRNLAVAVVSVDAANGTVTVKDLASKKSVLVRTNADCKLHRLPPFLAQMIAMFNSGQMPGGATPSRLQGGNAGEGARGGAKPDRNAGGDPGGGRPPGATAGRPSGNAAEGGMDGALRDFDQTLEQTPALRLDELKPGDPLIVVSTTGVKPAEVTAIILLAGVEPILAAQPKGSSQVVLGPWNMGMGGGEGGP